MWKALSDFFFLSDFLDVFLKASFNKNALCVVWATTGIDIDWNDHMSLI